MKTPIFLLLLVAASCGARKEVLIKELKAGRYKDEHTEISLGEIDVI